MRCSSLASPSGVAVDGLGVRRRDAAGAKASCAARAAARRHHRQPSPITDSRSPTAITDSHSHHRQPSPSPAGVAGCRRWHCCTANAQADHAMDGGAGCSRAGQQGACVLGWQRGMVTGPSSKVGDGTARGAMGEIEDGAGRMQRGGFDCCPCRHWSLSVGTRLHHTSKSRHSMKPRLPLYLPTPPPTRFRHSASPAHQSAHAHPHTHTHPPFRTAGSSAR